MRWQGKDAGADYVNFETGAGEPPRLYRRVIYLSQAAMPDRFKLS